MSSVAYGNGGVPSNGDTSISSIPLSSSGGAIIQHPYITSNTNPAYTVAAAAVSSASPSSLGQYQHYYGHPLSQQQQQLLHVQQPSSFYPPAISNHLQHHTDFSNSSSSVASSSSSIELSRKTTNRKRQADKTIGSTKSGIKRKAVCFKKNLVHSISIFLFFSQIIMKMILMTMMMMKKINVIYVVLHYQM
jgi:hypothetical protein